MTTHHDAAHDAAEMLPGLGFRWIRQRGASRVIYMHDDCRCLIVIGRGDRWIFPRNISCQRCFQMAGEIARSPARRRHFADVIADEISMRVGAAVIDDWCTGCGQYDYSSYSSADDAAPSRLAPECLNDEHQARCRSFMLTISIMRFLSPRPQTYFTSMTSGFAAICA